MRVSVWVLALTCLMGSGDLVAQDRDLPRFSVEARAGYTNPTRELGRTPVLQESQTALGYVAFGEVEATPVLGVGATARLHGPLSLRLLADYGLETSVEGQWFCDVIAPCPAVLQLVKGDVRTWSVGADLRLALPQIAWGLEPTAFVGVARRSYRIRWNSPIPEVPIPTAHDQANYHLRPGLGVARTFGSVAFFAEADASIGDFGAELPVLIEGTTPSDDLGDRGTQFDIGLSVGARFVLW